MNGVTNASMVWRGVQLKCLQGQASKQTPENGGPETTLEAVLVHSGRCHSAPVMRPWGSEASQPELQPAPAMALLCDLRQVALSTLSQGLCEDEPRSCSEST